MNFLIINILLIFATVIVGDDVYPKNELEEEILLLLKKWRKGSVQTKLFPLPSLKFFEINGVQSNYHGNGIHVTYSIGNMKLIGFDNFNIQKLDVNKNQNSLDISMSIAIPELTLYSDKYELSGKAYYMYKIHGNGAMTIITRKNLISLDIRFTLSGNNYTLIENFTLGYEIGKVDANLENCSWPIIKVLNYEGASILASYHTNIDQAVRNYAMPYANSYLENITPTDFLKIIADISVNSYVDENF